MGATTAAIGATTVPYAHWARRLGGYLIDCGPTIAGNLLLGSAYLLFLLALMRSEPAGGLPVDLGPPVAVLAAAGASVWLIGLAWVIYSRWLRAGLTGQSVGRRMMQTALVGEQTGRPIGPFNAFVRDLVHILDGLAYVGFLWPLWDDKRQTFADMLMRTVVIDLRSAPIQGHGVQGATIPVDPYGG